MKQTEHERLLEAVRSQRRCVMSDIHTPHAKDARKGWLRNQIEKHSKELEALETVVPEQELDALLLREAELVKIINFERHKKELEKLAKLQQEIEELSESIEQ